MKFTPPKKFVNQKEFIKLLFSKVDLFPTVKTNKDIKYYNIPAAFDIEVSSFYSNGEKTAVMYVWQFSVLNFATYGRTWEELRLLILALKIIFYDGRLPVYVHNLPYEWQFIRKHFNWDKVFFLDERKPVYAITGQIEFRCSLKLSGKSLANTAKDLQKYKVKKLVGDLDYSKVRFPTTPLTDEELGYCLADVAVVTAYIQEKIEQDGDVTKIPLTNTGYVRNYCRKRSFREIMEEMSRSYVEINGRTRRIFGTARGVSRRLYSR